MSSNKDVKRDKLFHVLDDSSSNATIEGELKNVKQSKTETLPNMVTICLAPCSLCVGEYVDITNRFILRCCCPCHHNRVDRNDEVSA
jgi:hypothetical protein